MIAQCPGDQTVFAGETAVFSVTVSGTPPFRYQWSVKHAPIGNATNATLVFSNASFGDSDNEYWVEVRNDHGVDLCGNMRLTVLPASPIPGFLDGTFSAPGGFGNAVIRQPDGRFLAGGGQGVIRLWPDGAVDASFSNQAVRDVAMMARQSDGKVVVLAGGLLRLNTDGTLDSSFALDLTRNDPFIRGVRISALAVQSDDKILIAYRVLRASSFDDDHWLDPIVRRFNPDGSDDASFAWNVFRCEDVRGIAVMPDDGILIGTHDVIRLRSGGQRDTDFNPSRLEPRGTACLSPGLVYCFAFQTDDKILVGGAFTNVQGQARSHIARLNTNGTLDLSFNPPVSSGTEETIVRALALQPDGRILVGGNFETMDAMPREGLARLNPDGSLDTTFVTGAGLLDDEDNSVLSIVVQSPDKAIVGGSVGEYWGVPVGLMRIYLEDAPTDSDCDRLPDTWETRYFGSMTGPNASAAADPDLDRMNNRDECLAGTNPLQASSLLKILAAERFGSEVSLRFPTVAGRLYQVEHTKGFDNPDWDGIDETILGTGDIHSINIPVDAAQHHRFFRVRLVR